MGKSDELTDEELRYLESGGTAPISGIAPPAEHTDGNPQVQSEPQPSAEVLQESQPAASEDQDAQGTDADDESEGDEFTVITGRDGKTRLKGKDGKFVSHKALHAEREKRKAIQAERDDLKLRLARGEERLAILNEAFNGGARPADGAQQPKVDDDPLAEEAVDAAKDPFGAIEQLRRQNAALSQRFHGHQTQAQQSDTLNRVKEVYHTDARRLMTEDPNFEAGYRFLVGQRHKELEVMGLADEAERNRVIAQEETSLVIEALRAKMSPAQAIYNIAKARGFAPSQAPAEASNGDQPSRNGAPDPAKVSAAAEKIANVKRGQQASDTLSVAGSSPSGSLTFAQLAAMNDEEFAAAIDSMSKAQVERMLGR